MNLKKMPKKLLLQGGAVYDPFLDKSKKANILIENNKISAMGSKIKDNDATKINCKGLVITHGFCDLHVHFREPGQEHKETLKTGSLAALAGGFTRV